MARQAALLATLALLAITASPAQAYQFAGKRWPGNVVPYAVDAPLYDGAVDSAARAWNRAGVGITFTRVPLDRARLIIRSGSSRAAGIFGCRGENARALLGWPGAYYSYSTIGFTGVCRSARTRRVIAMHELGHALGLDHENGRCALMNSSVRVRSGLPKRCRGRRIAARLARGPLPDDLRGARRLYRRPSPTEEPAAARFHRSGASIAHGRMATFSAGLRNSRLTYAWNFGDPASGPGNIATGMDASHAFSAPGMYEVTLEVVDGGAVIARRSRTVMMSGQP